MKHSQSPLVTFRRTSVFSAVLLLAVLVATRFLQAETETKKLEAPKETLATAATDDREALLARLTKILNYGSEISLAKPTKTDAVIALGLIGDERSVPVLVDHLLNEENKNLRLQIVRVLGWIGSDKAVPALEQALQDKYPLLRKQAAEVLKQITGREYEYDKTGLPDYNKLREMIRASAKEVP